jgi:dihydroorotate dehydrogenase (NAD+) catalytic subunit
MMSDKLPSWFPAHAPIYDISKTYLENAQYGPFFMAPFPERKWPSREKWKTFFDHPIASPIGIAAGPLLNSRWVDLASKLGYDILTYKTIRSGPYPAHPLPNMLYIQTDGMLKSDTAPPLQTASSPPSKIENLAVTNSFGMPSMSREFLMEDIPKARQCLQKGQVLVVSVVGTPGLDHGFLEDFVEVACFAKECGASIIEANFSCPNVDKRDGCLYTSPQIVTEFASAIAKAIHPIPLILKVGVFLSAQHMKDVMEAAAKSGVRGLSGINTLSRTVLNSQGQPALGTNRFTSGICGGPIRDVALQFVQQAAEINKKETLGLTLIGVGGVTLAAHFDLFLEAGADIAQTATGMMWDPYLALRYHQLHGEPV